jgi:UDP-N-acetylmuramate-alanine ligase
MKRIHLIGICGTAMATLAALLKSRGHDVRGSDQNVYPPMSDFLAEQQITTLQGYKPEHIGADLDLVVVGNAISRGNPELEEVLDRKIRYCSLPEAVRDHFLWGARSVVIAGTHGKTTTTSLTGWVLTHGGADPSVFIGGIAENFAGSYRIGGGREFVIEGGRVRQRVLRQDRQVPQVPARHRGRQQHRVRSRGYLRRSGIDPRRVQAPREPGPQPRPAARRRRRSGSARARAAGALPR